MRNSSLLFSNWIVSHSCCVGRGLVLGLMLAVLLFHVCLPVQASDAGRGQRAAARWLQGGHAALHVCSLQMRANTKPTARCTGRVHWKIMPGQWLVVLYVRTSPQCQ